VRIRAEKQFCSREGNDPERDLGEKKRHYGKENEGDQKECRGPAGKKENETQRGDAVGKGRVCFHD